MGVPLVMDQAGKYGIIDADVPDVDIPIAMESISIRSPLLQKDIGFVMTDGSSPFLKMVKLVSEEDGCGLYPGCR